MTSRLFRSLRLGVVAFAFVFGPAAWYVSPAFDTRPACQRGGDWVVSNPKQLPKTLDTFAAFPIGMRRAVFSALSPETKAALWQDQLRRFASSRSLSIDQQHLVDRAAAIYVPASYLQTEGPPSASMQKMLDDITQDAKTLFASNDFRAFYVLGDSIAPVQSLSTVRLHLTDTIRNYGSAAASSQMPECNCQSDPDCAGGSHCGGVNPCSDTWGCGPGGILQCRLLCIYN